MRALIVVLLLAPAAVCAAGKQTLDDGWPAGWSKPELWSYSRRDYYRFTGWSHENGNMRGGVAVPC